MDPILTNTFFSYGKLSASPLERRVRLQIEEEDNTNCYLLILKREISSQDTLMNPKSLGEAQNFAPETEMWIKESHQPTRQHTLPPRPPIALVKKPTPPLRIFKHPKPFFTKKEKN